jgi:hypothetical protein
MGSQMLPDEGGVKVYYVLVFAEPSSIAVGALWSLHEAENETKANTIL